MVSLVLGLTLTAVSPATAELPTRPRDPWVFRSVLDKQARMVTVELSEHLIIAYDATNCGFYKAWEGTVKFQGAVYTAEHGPQPTSVGKVYEQDTIDRAIWSVANARGEVTEVKPRFRGYTMKGGQVEFNYEIPLGSKFVTVNEIPEALPLRLGRVGLERRFNVSGLARGERLFLDVATKFVAPDSRRAYPMLTPTEVELRNGTNVLSTRYGAPVDPAAAASATGQGLMASLKPEPTVAQESSQVRVPGIAMRLYDVGIDLERVPRLVGGQTPNYSVVVPKLDLGNDDFGDLKERFLGHFSGFLNVRKAGRHQFRLASDDGSKFFLGDELVIDHDGLHGASEPKTGYLDLSPGEIPLFIEFFENQADAALRLEWKEPGDAEWSIVPTEVLTAQGGEVRVTAPGTKRVLLNGQSNRPGDRSPLEGVHPAWTLQTIDVPGFEPRVGGIDFLPDGRMVVCTWDEVGGVYIVDNVWGTVRKPTVKRIAAGLAEPLGLKVVNGEIYVLQKQELTKLVDLDGDEVTDRYYALANGWGVTANFHEFAFGLVHRGNTFYAALATAIDPGGRSTRPQNEDRGWVVAINDKTGEYRKVANGLRTPNGIGVGWGGRFYITDNQGDWLPSSKVLPLQEGAYYGNASVGPESVTSGPVTPPVVWLPQNEIGNSPSQPARFTKGPFAGQMMHGDVTHGGLKRVYVEEVDGVLQGCVFRFTQGMMAGINRVMVGPDGSIFVGGIGSTGNWAQTGKKWYGLQKITYNGDHVFEMKTVRPMQNGIEIEFTEPANIEQAADLSLYDISQWRYEPNEAYGGPKVDEGRLVAKSVTVTEGGRRIFLEVDGLKEDHVFYVRIHPALKSKEDRALWSTEAWYTLNKMPNRQGTVNPTLPTPPNTLSAEEAASGFKLLFNGESLAGWIGFRKPHVPAGWSVQNGELTFTPGKEGGDLRTLDEYGDFELRMQWKISRGGNSGIFYRCTEEYNVPYMTGIEMQVLDNDRHNDGTNALTSAGSVYGLYAAPPGITRNVGDWNDVRIVARGPIVEHYLNNHLVARIDLSSMEWANLIAGSKFRDWKDFGKRARGYIAVQDHGDVVAYRSIRIKPLD